MDLGAVRERVSESTAAISPSADTTPVMVAGIIATQSRTANIAAPLQPLENQAKRLGLGCTLHNANVAVGGALPTAFALTIRY